jgi:hypothetical protein
MKKYKIELDEDALKVVSAALDLYTRVNIGQLEAVCEEPFLKDFMDRQIDAGRASYENYYDNPLAAALKVAKIELTGSANGNPGIFNGVVPQSARVAAHVRGAIRHRLYLEDEDRSVGAASPPSIVKGLDVFVDAIRTDAAAEVLTLEKVCSPDIERGPGVII